MDHRTLFDLGARAFAGKARTAMRFLLLQRGWESAVCGAVASPGGVRWLVQRVWPELPWDHFIAWRLEADGVQCLDSDWFDELRKM